MKRVLNVLGVNTDPVEFERQTEMWLATMGTLIEAIPEDRRSKHVDIAIGDLADGVRGVGEVQPAADRHRQVVVVVATTSSTVVLVIALVLVLPQHRELDLDGVDADRSLEIAGGGDVTAEGDERADAEPGGDARR
ncbi:hypothetical protein IAE22_29565, partial [Bacillus sp. S34]|nr:hypothetical protein [Bacillus sp. S34]